jgi:type IV secretory pathway TraG/TraD family ATPase VirD4
VQSFALTALTSLRAFTNRNMVELTARSSFDLASIRQQKTVVYQVCVFRGDAPTDSDLMRPPVPISSAHRFRGIRPPL